uniref:Predicted protein n=1 Tax=Hordeum vulgare subsp. vulgare TaxID=112509 RepID=F2E5Y7_HORVV|nr:predicted protein [Hordeum vulgare subsp. vulgare]
MNRSTAPQQNRRSGPSAGGSRSYATVTMPPPSLQLADVEPLLKCIQSTLSESKANTIELAAVGLRYKAPLPPGAKLLYLVQHLETLGFVSIQKAGPQNYIRLTADGAAWSDSAQNAKPVAAVTSDRPSPSHSNSHNAVPPANKPLMPPAQNEFLLSAAQREGFEAALDFYCRTYPDDAHTIRALRSELERTYAQACSWSVKVSGIPANLRYSPASKTGLAQHLKIDNRDFISWVYRDHKDGQTKAVITFLQSKTALKQANRASHMLWQNPFVYFDEASSVLTLEPVEKPVERVLFEQWDAVFQQHQHNHAAPEVKVNQAIIPPDRPPRQMVPTSQRCINTIFKEEATKRLEDRKSLVESKSPPSIGIVRQKPLHNNTVYFACSSRDERKQIALGEGSEGTVWLAKAVNGTWVAVKQYLANKVNFCERDVDNVKVVVSKSNQDTCLLNYHHYQLPAEDSDFGFIEMDLAIASLQDRITALQKIPWGQDELFAVNHDLVRACDAMQSANVVHRDIRAANFLYLPNGGLRLADFGLSKELQAGMTTMGTLSSGILHQPYEVLAALDANEEVKARPSVDIFMLGMVMCYAATGGRYPYGTGHEREQSVEISKRSGPTVVLKDVTDSCLRSLLIWMLDHDYAMRPTINEVRDHPYFLNHNMREGKMNTLHHNLKSSDTQERTKKLLTNVREILRREGIERMISEWPARLPPVVRAAFETPTFSLYGTLESAVVFVRNGLAHLRENLQKHVPALSQDDWNTVISDASTGERWSSVNEFFFCHSSISWLLPAYYRALSQLSRAAREETNFISSLQNEAEHMNGGDDDEKDPF